MCDDAVTSLSIAEVGKWDQHLGQWVTAQPYQVGVLLSSSNASTWTPHQDRDLTFRLLRAVFDPTPITVELGSADVEKATDLMLMALADQPTAAARIEYQLALPDESRLSVAEGQPVRLAEPLTGNVTVAAKISGTAQFSPVLYPGVQLVSGATQVTADYVTRAILGGKSSRVRGILDAAVPAGAGVNIAHSDSRLASPMPPQ